MLQTIQRWLVCGTALLSGRKVIGRSAWCRWKPRNSVTLGPFGRMCEIQCRQRKMVAFVGNTQRHSNTQKISQEILESNKSINHFGLDCEIFILADFDFVAFGSLISLYLTTSIGPGRIGSRGLWPPWYHRIRSLALDAGWPWFKNWIGKTSTTAVEVCTVEVCTVGEH